MICYVCNSHGPRVDFKLDGLGIGEQIWSSPWSKVRKDDDDDMNDYVPLENKGHGDDVDD